MRVTPQQAIAIARQRREGLRAQARAVLFETAQDCLEKAVEWSSGTKSLQELAAMDHPYAKRHASPGLPPFIINEQSGAFRANWRMEWTAPLRIRIINDDPKVRFLKGGTALMHDRPIEQALKDYIRPRFERRVARLRK